MKKLWIAIVRLFGWKYDLPDVDTIRRLHHSIIIEAPHTSIYDYLLGASCMWKMGLKPCIFIKKEFFVFPLRRLLRHYGAIAVDRGNPGNHMVNNAVEALNNNEDITIVITPEGTRKMVKRFKKGFYEIAMQTGVPVAVTYIDYKKRHMGVGPLMMPTGDFNADMMSIINFYRDITPRNASGWSIQVLEQTYREKKTDN